MTTTIEKKFDINQPIELVWKSLANPEDIVVCVPGASITDKIDDRNYKGAVVTKFGPIKASYAGDIEIVELDESQSKMTLKGRGLDSKGKGSADMLMVGTLSEEAGVTHVNFKMDITIIGTLAQFGSRLINDVSDQLLNQFVKNFKEKLAQEAGQSNDTSEEASQSDDESSEVVEASSESDTNNNERVKNIQSQSDNSLDASSLIGTVIKSIFGGFIDSIKSLFGGKK